MQAIPGATRAGHGALRALVAYSRRRFIADAGDPEREQRRRLAQVLALASTRQPCGMDIDRCWTWEQFRDALPVTDWAYWQPSISALREQGGRGLLASPLVRFQPTSGSTSAIKLLPYTARFLQELDGAIGPWLADLYATYPRLASGRHYWSVSWVPDEFRARFRDDLNDDLRLLSLGKRLVATATQAVPQSVAMADTADGTLFATLAFLAADAKLGMLSVWSPTFGTMLLEKLGRWREPLAQVLAEGRWPDFVRVPALPAAPRSPRAAALLRAWDGGPDPAFFRELWPALALVSAWDSASSTAWAQRLRELLPHAAFQGKGLWATEGVVTIPFAGRFPLAYKSHVYEFEDLDSGRVLAPWQLRRGQSVVPLLTTGSGLLRYRMNDVVEVDDFLGNVPCLRFIGRNDGVDLVGEKTSAAFVQQVVDRVALPPALRPVTLLATTDSVDGMPGYVWLLDGDDVDAGQAAGTMLERAMSMQFHYRLARDLGQLAPVRVVVAADMQARYVEMRLQHGMIEGNVKIEPLLAWRRPLPAFLRGRAHAVPAVVEATS